MVSMSVVFGARAGKYAAERALEKESADLTEEILSPALQRLDTSNSGNREAEEVFKELQAVMGCYFMNFKTNEGCAIILDKIAELRTDYLPNLKRNDLPSLRRAIEAENCVQVAEIMVRAARTREESRGNHYRDDFPQKDEKNWRKNIIHSMKDGKLTLRTRSLE